MSKKKSHGRRILFTALLFLCSLFLYANIPTSPPEKLLNRLEVSISNYSESFKEKPGYAILIDFDRPVFRKRLWVINTESKEVIIHSRVSHAYKSGILWATKFSNDSGSNQSCKGIFKTMNSYESTYGKGKYKIGMRIQGLDTGTNDNAFNRYIVFHSSYSPWSHGCFMTSPHTNKKIIDLTKNGSIVIVD